MLDNHVLYRKYRPKTFAEVRGQEEVVKTLEQAVKSGKPAHAYLFTGGRGTGKTTLARILAKSLDVSDHDIVEMDAASNRGVDDVRQLREAVQTLPMESTYKVFIIDEVHMLTKEAFNALLKTLEEPPKHVLFILATTELDRVPDTIRSRCQVYRLKNPSHAVLGDLVRDIVKSEGYAIDTNAVRDIVRTGDGSFRDTLGALQRIMTHVAGEKITSADTSVVFELPSREHIHILLGALAGGNGKSAIETLATIGNSGKALERFMEHVIDEVRTILLARFAPDVIDLGGESDDYKTAIETFKKEKMINSDLLAKLLTVYNDMKKTSLPQVPITIFLSAWFEKK